MKVSELTADMVVEFSKIDIDASDRWMIGNIFLPAAKAEIIGRTGLTAEQMDKHEDLTVGVCTLCLHMYDNRSMTIDSDKENKVIGDIIEKYSCNLLPRRDSV